MNLGKKIIMMGLLIPSMLTYSMLFAQESSQDLAQKSTTELGADLTRYIESEQYLYARPIIEILIQRYSDLKDPESKSKLDSLNFFMGAGYFYEFLSTKDVKFLESAIPYFDYVIKNFPNGSNAVKALELKASCENGLGKFVEAGETWGRVLQPPYSDNLTNNERFAILKKIADTFYVSKKWAEGEKWFERVYKEARNKDDKIYGGMALIQTHFSKEEFDKAKDYYFLLAYDTPTRFDIGLSVAFLKAGDSLASMGKYADASLCFTFVKTKEEILKFNENQRKKLEKALKRAKENKADNNTINDIENRIYNLDQLLAVVKDIPEYNADLLARRARNYFETKRNYESFWAYYQLIDDFPTHGNIEDFYYACFLGALGIGKESQIEKVADEYKSKFGIEGKHYIQLSLQYAQHLLKTNQIDKFTTIALEVINSKPKNEFAPEFIFLLGKTYLNEKQYEELRNQFLKYIEKNPDSKAVEGATYWVAMAYLGDKMYPESRQKFEELLKSYPETQYAEDATYRMAVCAFGNSEIELAAKLFKEFITKYSSNKSKLIGEAHYFLGDLNSLLEKFDEARENYMAVDEYTDNTYFVNSAYLQCAKMQAKRRNFEDAANILHQYINKHPEGNISYITYLRGEYLLKIGRYADAVNSYVDIIENHGNEKDSDGVDNIMSKYPHLYNMSKKELDASVKFFKEVEGNPALFKTLVTDPRKRYRYFEENPLISRYIPERFKEDKQFGENLLSDPTPFKNLQKMFEDQGAKFPKMNPSDFLNKKLSDARKDGGSKVFELRLLMILDLNKYLKEELKLFTIDDMDDASYKVLLWIAAKNEKYGVDDSRQAILKIINSEVETEYKMDALMQLADLEYRNRNFDEALSYFKRAEDEYPADPRSAKAAIRQGDALKALNRFDEAKSKYSDILRVANWKGEPHAESMYKLGLLERDTGNANAAIMWFDRCALGFSTYYNIVGKAVLEGAKVSAMNGMADKAKEFCDIFLSDPANKESPEYEAIKDFRKSL